jgi:hypothetical protein
MKLLLNEIKKVVGSEEEIEVLENLSSENLTFLLTYIIPIVLKINGIRDLLSLAILFSIIFFIYVNSDLLRYNIFFNIFGYNIYKVKFNNKDMFLICKGKLSKGLRKLDLNEFYNDILVGR